MVLAPPTLVELLPVDLADALEERATAIGTDAMTLAVAILRSELAVRPTRHGCPVPRSVGDAIEQYLAAGPAQRSDIATWLAVTCGWRVTLSTLRTVISLRTTAGRIRRREDGRYEAVRDGPRAMVATP